MHTSTRKIAPLFEQSRLAPQLIYQKPSLPNVDERHLRRDQWIPNELYQSRNVSGLSSKHDGSMVKSKYISPSAAQQLKTPAGHNPYAALNPEQLLKAAQKELAGTRMAQSQFVSRPNEEPKLKDIIKQVIFLEQNTKIDYVSPNFRSIKIVKHPPSEDFRSIPAGSRDHQGRLKVFDHTDRSPHILNSGNNQPHTGLPAGEEDIRIKEDRVLNIKGYYANQIRINRERADRQKAEQLNGLASQIYSNMPRGEQSLDPANPNFKNPNDGATSRKVPLFEGQGSVYYPSYEGNNQDNSFFVRQKDIPAVASKFSQSSVIKPFNQFQMIRQILPPAPPAQPNILLGQAQANDLFLKGILNNLV